MAQADLLSVQCLWGIIPYRHYGIDMGDGTVIHLATLASNPEVSREVEVDAQDAPQSVFGTRMMVQRVAWDTFADGKPVRIEQVNDALPAGEVLSRAEHALGNTYYNLAFGNCEHFARSWKTGEHQSHQSDRLIRGAVRAGLAGLAATANQTIRKAVFSGAVVNGAAAGTTAAISRAAGVATMVGEVARHSVYAASRQAELEHTQAERNGRRAGLLSAALTGLITRGPVGCVSATALYITIEAMSTHAANAGKSQSKD
jgi:hypothetical protein